MTQRGKEKKQLVSMAEFARHAGVNRSTVSRMVRAGVLSTVAGRIDLEKARLEFEKRHDPAWDLRRAAAKRDDVRELRGNSPQEISAGLSYYEAHAIREQVQAKLLLLELKKREGKLVDADEILLAHHKVWSTLRSNLRGIPRKLASRLAAAKKEAECERLVAEAIDAELKRTVEKPFGKAHGK